MLAVNSSTVPLAAFPEQEETLWIPPPLLHVTAIADFLAFRISIPLSNLFLCSHSIEYEVVFKYTESVYLEVSGRWSLCP